MSHRAHRSDESLVRVKYRVTEPSVFPCGLVSSLPVISLAREMWAQIPSRRDVVTREALPLTRAQSTECHSSVGARSFDTKFAGASPSARNHVRVCLREKHSLIRTQQPARSRLRDTRAAPRQTHSGRRHRAQLASRRSVVIASSERLLPDGFHSTPPHLEVVLRTLRLK